MSKNLRETIEKHEKQKKIIAGIQKAIEEWANYDLEQKHKFNDSLPLDLAVLPDTDSEMIITDIAEAGIYGKTRLRKKVKQAKEQLGIEEKELPIKIAPHIIEEELTPIHPALDFTDNLAFTTIPIMCIVPEIKKGKQEDRPPEPVYYTITSQKEMFVLTAKELTERGFYSFTQACILDNRWRYPSIKAYLEGKTNPPDPSNLFSDIRGLFDKFMDYRDKRLYDYFTYWVIGTYLFPLFPAYPYVYLTGKSGTGKSKTIKICEGLSFNAMNSGNISDASFFRLIEGSRATLLLDELESIADPEQRNNLLNLILAGFIKGAKVIRTEKTYKDQFIPKRFEVHSPKIIANIKGMPTEALKNRCVTFVTSPTKSNKAKIEPNLNDAIWQEIRNKLYIFTLENWRDIRITSKVVESDLKGYAHLQWQPILTLAKFFSGYLGSDKSFLEMQSLAMEKTREREEEKKGGYDIQLLETVINLVSENEKYLDHGEKEGKTFYSSEDIRGRYVEDLGRTEPPKWLTPQKVGRMLNSFDIGKAGRYGTERKRGIWINLSGLKDVANRFGIEKEIPEIKPEQLNLQDT